MAAQPGRERPSASASAFMVEAVPIELQWPIEGAAAATESMYSAKSILPAANSLAEAHLTVPDPAREPFHQPLSIGPPESTIAGMFTVAAAMMAAGVVLSQPVVSTTPSSGYPNSTSTR